MSITATCGTTIIRTAVTERWSDILSYRRLRLTLKQTISVLTVLALN